MLVQTIFMVKKTHLKKTYLKVVKELDYLKMTENSNLILQIKLNISNMYNYK